MLVEPVDQEFNHIMEKIAYLCFPGSETSAGGMESAAGIIGSLTFHGSGT